jgi:ABC-type multidrug transport system fused ATPase/permease subunit
VKRSEASLWSIFRKVLRGPEKRSLALVGVLSLVGVFVETLSVGLVLPFLTVLVSNDLSADLPWLPEAVTSLDQARLVLFATLTLVAVYLAKFIFVLWSQWVQSGIRIRVGAGLSQALFDSYLSKPHLFFVERNSSVLIRNLQNAAAVINGGFEPAMTIVVDSLVAASLLGLLFVIEPIATSVTLALFATYAIAFHLLTRKRLRNWGTERLEYSSQLLRHQQQAIGGTREIRIAGVADYFSRLHLESLLGAGRIMRKFNLLVGLPRLSLEIVTLGGLVILINLLVLGGRSSQETLPILGLFAVTAFRVQPTITRTINNLGSIKFNRTLINEVYSDLEFDLQPEDRRSLPPGRFKELRLEGVRFRYPGSDSETLEGVDMLARKGEIVGISGESGSGKSTLMDLLLGLLTPVSGSIYVDGERRSLDTRAWRDMTGYVPQSIYLLDDSIRKNVAFGLADEDIDEARITACLKDVELEQFIESLAQGVETRVGERGARLSGGQRQRLGIARALYHRPEILFLDEATSALDPQTESQILATLATLSSQVTIVLIAHRESTLSICTSRFHLNNGSLNRI